MRSATKSISMAILTLGLTSLSCVLMSVTCKNNIWRRPPPSSADERGAGIFARTGIVATAGIYFARAGIFASAGKGRKSAGY